ncbi:MAG: nuclear transport factor 2 family protein [Acidimicrobiales bacterium]
MIDTTNTPGQVVQAYYDLLKYGTASFDEGRLRGILASDLVFEGPIAGHVVGAERFIKGVSGFVETVRSLDMLHQQQAGQMAAALYDAEMPGGTVRFAEFFHIDGGKIRSLRLLYDATEYRARGGR